MKVRNILLAVLFMLLIITNTSKTEAVNNSIVSRGRIVYDNETPNNSSDDVIIFDAEDLIQLNHKIDALADKL